MHIAIIDHDAIFSYVLTQAAVQRGCRVVSFSSAERLRTNLPWSPSTIVVAVEEVGEPELAMVATAREAAPSAVILVKAEEAEPGAFPSVAKAGGTDLIAGPVNPFELLVKAQVWVQAMGHDSLNSSVQRLEDLEVDFARYRAVKNGKVLVLTKLELRLLYCLLEHQPHLTPIERLLAFGWDDDVEGDASHLRTHMCHLRKKLRLAGGVPLEINSRQTLGYVLCAAQAQMSKELAS